MIGQQGLSNGTPIQCFLGALAMGESRPTPLKPLDLQWRTCPCCFPLLLTNQNPFLPPKISQVTGPRHPHAVAIYQPQGPSSLKMLSPGSLFSALSTNIIPHHFGPHVLL